MKKIYLAGPDVFAPNPSEIGEHKKAVCARHGLEGIFPMDFVTLDPSQPKISQGMYIFDIMERAMSDCDAMIVNLTPFHGPSMDIGSAVEIGFMRALGKPIFGYSNTGACFADRVVSFWQGKISVCDTGERRGADSMSLEEFDMRDNLMAHGSIERSTGVFVTHDVPSERQYADLGAFDNCVAAAAKWFSEHQPPGKGDQVSDG